MKGEAKLSKMDDESNSNLVQKIQQYQNSIIKHSENENDERILYYIKKLYDMPVTVEHLKETGIGRTMNSLRKYNGDVGIASKAIVSKWKVMVASEDPEIKMCRPTIDNTPPQSPVSESSDEKQKVKSDRKEEKYSKRDDSRDKHKHHDSSDRSRKIDDRHRSKSNSKSENKKSSHKDKSHKSRHDDKYKKEEKTRDNKRKIEEERTSSKKMKYEANSSDSEDSNRLLVDNLSISSLNSEDNILPDSTTHYDSRESTQSPVEKIERKQHKSDKHEKHRSRDKDKKEINGSSKKSSHKEKEKSESKREKSSKSSTTSSSSTSSSTLSSLSSKDSLKISSSSKNPDKPKKMIVQGDNGIDSGSGASFAEALGMIEPTKSNKIKKKSTTSSSPTPSTSSSVKSSKSTPRTRTQSPLAQQSPNLLSPHMKLEPLDNSIVSQLPEITTNYKPLGLNFDSPYGNVKNMSQEEALSVVISSKTQRTKVYSGVKTNWGYVPTLFQLCVRILQDNIDALEYTGGVPYEILKPVLERATANQLLNAEYYNPYLIEESDELWESHCKRECKGLKRQEMESWREMYLRCRDERDAKLKALTVNIKQSIDKSLPVRQTKLAYVDSVVKPPRGVARKQAKYGTSENLKKPLITPTQRLNSIASGSGEKISVPNPGPRAVSSSSASVIKPKKAPLMQKTLALMKGRFGRR